MQNKKDSEILNIVKVTSENDLDIIISQNTTKLILTYFCHSDKSIMNQFTALNIKKYLKRQMTKINNILILYIDLKFFSKTVNKYTMDLYEKQSELSNDKLPCTKYIYNQKLIEKKYKNDIDSIIKTTLEVQNKLQKWLDIIQEERNKKILEDNKKELSIQKEQKEIAHQIETQNIIQNTTQQDIVKQDVPQQDMLQQNTMQKDNVQQTTTQQDTSTSMNVKQNNATESSVQHQSSNTIEQNNDIVNKNNINNENTVMMSEIEQHALLHQQTITKAKLDKIEELKNEYIIKELERVKLSKRENNESDDSSVNKSLNVSEKSENNSYESDSESNSD